MALQSLRLADGSAVRLVSDICKLPVWTYARDEDGNDQLTTSPSSNPSNPITRTVRLFDGSDAVAVTK